MKESTISFTNEETKRWLSIHINYLFYGNDVFIVYLSDISDDKLICQSAKYLIVNSGRNILDQSVSFYVCSSLPWLIAEKKISKNIESIWTSLNIIIYMMFFVK